MCWVMGRGIQPKNFIAFSPGHAEVSACHLCSGEHDQVKLLISQQDRIVKIKTYNFDTGSQGDPG